MNEIEQLTNTPGSPLPKGGGSSPTYNDFELIRGVEEEMIIVDVRNEILGNSEFWRGNEEDISKIRNIVAKSLAVRVAKDGQPRSSGMWFVRKETP